MELRRYLTALGRDVFGEWLSEQRDVRTRAKIVARIDRFSAGNFGDPQDVTAHGRFDINDFHFGKKLEGTRSLHRLTVVGNFTSHSFSQDQIGGGAEYSLGANTSLILGLVLIMVLQTLFQVNLKK